MREDFWSGSQFDKIHTFNCSTLSSCAKLYLPLLIYSISQVDLVKYIERNIAGNMETTMAELGLQKIHDDLIDIARKAGEIITSAKPIVEGAGSKMNCTIHRSFLILIDTFCSRVSLLFTISFNTIPFYHVALLVPALMTPGLSQNPPSSPNG